MVNATLVDLGGLLQQVKGKKKMTFETRFIKTWILRGYFSLYLQDNSVSFKEEPVIDKTINGSQITKWFGFVLQFYIIKLNDCGWQTLLE